MTHHVCENKLCVNHLQLSAAESHRKNVRVYDEASGQIKLVARYLYRSARAGAEGFFLCETCHNAVEMTLK